MSKLGDFVVIPPDEWLFETHPDVMHARRRAEEYHARHGTYEGAEKQIEEFVRQWVLRGLVDEYGYPQEWFGERIVIEESVRMGATSKEADVSIKNATRRTYTYVETVVRGCSKAEFLDKERQLESYIAATHTATVGLVTDGDTTRCVRKKIDPNDFEYITDIPAYGASTASHARLARDVPEQPDGSRRTGLRTLSGDYERRLFECHSAIRDIDGLHADEALDELSKVLYAKVHDERSVLKKPVGAEFKFQVFGAANASEAASSIRELYDEARDADISVYAQRIPGYERSRGVFKAQIRLSDAALHRVVELLQEFSVVDSSLDVKGRAFQQVLGPAIRAGMGQYFTPRPVVDMAVRILAPTLEDLILDPFCGSSHFLTRSLDYVRAQNPRADPYALHEFKFFHLHGIEKSERMARIAMTDMMLHDDGHTNIRNTDALLSFDNYPDIIALRDDGSRDPAVFDIVITNPPFGSILKGEVMEIIGRFQLGHKRKSLPLEVIGLERCFQFLKPGGKLAIVLPDGILKNKNTQFVRRWVQDVAEVKAVISLPIETFAPFGALVKTSLCFFKKTASGETADPAARAFLAEIESVGYDAAGRPTGDLSEVDEVVRRFHAEVGW
ncbi:MAG TPA: N-6 DNA methylase [Conexibacter sp.]|nr:N-6 DNA methylase [Conexibacter sp.]